MEKELLGVKDLKQVVGLSKSTVYKLLRAGKFPAPIKKQGLRKTFWRREVVLAWCVSGGEEKHA